MTNKRSFIKLWLRPTTLVIGLCLCLSQDIQGQDSIHVSQDTVYILREVEIVSQKPTSVTLREKGDLSISPSSLNNTAQYWGQSDVINYLKSFSGVVSAGDYGAGLMIDGAESSQLLYRIGKVPVLFPYRFGGIFSSFNSSHFARVDFRRNILPAKINGRMGSVLDFEPSTVPPDHISSDISIGLIASSATCLIPINNKLGVTASARISYVDLLLGRLIQTSSTTLKYRFNDLNLTAVYIPHEGNRIIINAFHNDDNLKYSDDNYVIDTKLEWSNSLASIAWYNSSTFRMNNRLFFTGFESQLQFSLPQIELKAPSGIMAIGLSGELTPRNVSDKWQIEAGYEYLHYFNRAQRVEVFGFKINNTKPTEPNLRYADEGRLWGSAIFHLSENCDIDGGISSSVYRTIQYSQVMVDPRLTFNLKFNNHYLDVHFGRYSQSLHQLGFSETGMASDFWTVSSKYLPIQTSWGLSSDWFTILQDIGLDININLYWKQMNNQSEFTAQVIDILNEDYKSEDYILIGKGFNMGGNVTATYISGAWTVNGSLGYGIARRHYPGYDRWLRGRSDPGLSISSSVLWSPEFLPKWTFGTSFCLSSGRPYTPAKAMYVIAGNIITEFGLPNSSRLPIYHRLDLSAVWKISLPHDRVPGQSINFSIINAYGHQNVEIQKKVLDVSDLSLKTKYVYSLYRFMPSISYTLTFK